MVKKKTVTKVTTKTVLLVISGLVAAGALAYAGYVMSNNNKSTQACVDSCLEYQASDPEYVGICQQSCRTGEVIIYNNAPLDSTDTTGATSDQTALPTSDTAQSVQ